MIELEKAERQVIQPVCKDSDEVLILGAAEGSLGRVWVSKIENPTYCLILVGDFSYLIGIPPTGKLSMELKEQIYLVCHSSFITAADERWNHWFEEQFLGEYRKIIRYALKKEESQFDIQYLKALTEQIPEGYQLKQINKKIYQMALKEEWSKDFCINFADASHFLKEGLGFAIIKDNNLVAGCSAYGVGNHKLEVEVITKKEFRRKGLALICSAAFVLECLKRKMVPNWDAANLQSVALAEKLGYLFDREYEVYQLIVKID